MEEKAHIITERVFGSSRKIQFIGLESVPITNPTSNTTTTNSSRANNATTNNMRSSMDSLLSAIDHINSPNRRSSSNHQSMSIESLLSAESNDFHQSSFQHHRQSQSASTHEISVSSLLTSDSYTNYKRKYNDAPSAVAFKKQHLADTKSPSNQQQKSKIVCLHAAVAQKSYGSEKRFLCPPPIVQIKSTPSSKLTNEQLAEKYQLSMSVVCENTDKVLEQRSMLDENQAGSFKYLHVTGTAKAKQFHLQVDVLPIENDKSICSVLSSPISIISKPSKKTAKTRNVSTCILASSPVSLFNRINSQTVRTKYMTSCNNSLCAKNTSWSPFDIIIVNQPKIPQPGLHNTTISHQQHGKFTSKLQLNQQQQQKTPTHITYGTEIILRDTQTGVTSPSLIIRKVDKGRIAPCAYGPVSQMQKIALQLSSTIESQPIYLSASGSLQDTNNQQNNHTWLDYSPSRLIQPENMSLELSYEEVDDYLCWTIVGIQQFEHDFEEEINPNQDDSTTIITTTSTPSLSPSSPPTTTTTIVTPIAPSPPPVENKNAPYPILTKIEYSSQDHTLNVVGQNLMQAVPVPKLLELWLGTHGPLQTRISQPPKPHTPHETHWSIQLPSTQDLLVSNHDLLKQHTNNHRTLELNLLLVRQDGLVYHTGKALACDILNDTIGKWSVVPASV